MMIKKIIKRCLYVFLCLLSVFVLWLGFAYFHDESPVEGRNAFYAISSNDIADNQNIAIALQGFNAPSGVDIIKHGRFVVDTFDTREAELAKIAVIAAGTLPFVGTSEEFECWLDDSVKRTADNCASPERIKTLLSENQELLKRYRDLYNMPSWKGISGNGQYVLNLNKLILAEIKLDIAAGNSEIAFKKWLDNFQFISRAVGQEGTMIDRAVFLVADVICIGSLEDMLFKSPQISTTHFDELNTALKPGGLERYNLEGMMRAEYNFVNENLISKAKEPYFHPEFVRNRIYRFQMDYLDKANKPASTFVKTQRELAKKYSHFTKNTQDDWLDPFNSRISRLLLNGVSKGFELINSMHDHNGRIRLLNLSVKIRKEKIGYADIQTFLDYAGNEFNNPFTNLPMDWDADKKVLYFESLDRSYRSFEVRL